MPVTMMEVRELYCGVIEAAHGEDDEVAHSREDQLRELALQMVLDKHPDAEQAVRLALATSKIKFARWCA